MPTWSSRWRRPEEGEVGSLKSDSVLVGFLAPLTNGDGNKAIAKTGATAFAMDAIPRVTRAQPMDSLSSQSDCRRLQGGAERCREPRSRASSRC